MMAINSFFNCFLKIFSTNFLIKRNFSALINFRRTKMAIKIVIEKFEIVSSYQIRIKQISKIFWKKYGLSYKC